MSLPPASASASDSDPASDLGTESRHDELDPTSRGAAPRTDVPPARSIVARAAIPYALVIHAGAGSRSGPLPAVREAASRAGLEVAFRAGEDVLAAGGSALDAVTAAVVALEDDPQFNAGRGAALTDVGTAEMDAAVMSGDGSAGAVAGSRFARNPVRAARAVKERTEHVLVIDPDRERVEEWDLAAEDPDYFVTDLRRRQLARYLAEHRTGPKHGTVGAVALDADGNLAAATSTGGVTAQATGRIGDSPVIGAGTFARNDVVAISCTGHGEAFIEGAVAHEIDARIRLAGQDVATAARGTLDDEVRRRKADGGLIALGADGTAVVALDSDAIFAAYRDGDQVVTLV
jgi:beta-aspartyl-peptidase (threonine type)